MRTTEVSKIQLQPGGACRAGNPACSRLSAGSGRLKGGCSQAWLSYNFAAVGCLLLLLAGCRHSAPTLGLLVWEGYADPSFIAGFEQKCKCKVSASYMGSSDELVAKLRGGSAAN